MTLRVIFQRFGASSPAAAATVLAQRSARISPTIPPARCAPGANRRFPFDLKVLGGEQRWVLRQCCAESGIARRTRRRFDAALAGIHLHVRHRQRDPPLSTPAAAMLNPTVGEGAQAMVHVQRFTWHAALDVGGATPPADAAARWNQAAAKRRSSRCCVFGLVATCVVGDQ